MTFFDKLNCIVPDNLFFISKSDNRLIALEKSFINAKDYLTISVNSMRLIGKDKNIFSKHLGYRTGDEKIIEEEISEALKINNK